MGNVSSNASKINFEDVQQQIRAQDAVMISTLPGDRQACLIHGTLPAESEQAKINELLKGGNIDTPLIVYGENACDETIGTKYRQLLDLGFRSVHVYPGGLFEWVLLQDIYGSDAFPTTMQELDILKFKGRRKLGRRLLTNS